MHLPRLFPFMHLLVAACLWLGLNATAQTTEKWLVEPKYDYIREFSEGLAEVRLNDKWGYIDKTGKEVIPLNYEDARSFSEGLAGVKLNEKWGFIDKTGKEVIPLKYSGVWSFSEGLAIVALNNKWGFIDKTGKEAIPLKYDFVWSFSEGLAGVNLNGKRGFIDKTGKEVFIPVKYEYVETFSEGLAGVRLNGKWGFIDKTGKEVIPLKYEYVGSFSEGLAQVDFNKKSGFIDRTGKEVFPMKYDQIYWFSEGLAQVKLNGKRGFIDKTGKEVIPLKYEYVGSFSEGLAGVSLNGKWGVINKTGKEVIPMKYDQISWFSEGLAQVKLNGKRGFIDKTGKEVFIPVKYEYVESFSEGLAGVRLNGKEGFIDKTGKEVIPMKYKDVGSFSEGLAGVSLNGKEGFIDKTGKEVIPMKYEDTKKFSEGLVGVQLNGKWGFIYYPDSVKAKDSIPPTILITEPKSRGFYPITNEAVEVLVRGTATDASGVKTVRINQEQVRVAANGGFSKNVLLKHGSNSIRVEAEDNYGNRSEVSLAVEHTPPVPPMSHFGTYYAFIIGAERYEDSGAIPPLDYPLNDAKQLAEVLSKQYNFPASNIKLLPNPTLQDIDRQFDYYLNNLTENDNLLIFFAGHGYWDAQVKQGYWFLSDTRRNSRHTWLSNATLRDYLTGIRAKHILLISDACFSGSIFSVDRSIPAAASVAIQEIYKLPSRRAITSGMFTPVPDKSVFIEYLLKRLRENKKNYLPAEELFGSFKEAVINNMPVRGVIPKYGVIQATGDEDGDFIFIKK